MEFTPARTIGFATIVCLVCAVLVSSAAVGLKERQKENEALDRQKKVLDVAGLLSDAIASNPEELKKVYADRVKPTLHSLLKDKDGCKGVEVNAYDQIKASKDPATSATAPAGNRAKVQRVPNCGLLYEITSAKDKSKVETAIIPVEGKGLWSTLYGFIALDTNGVDIKGLTFYKHAETPGLGGEVDNPKWKAKWVGKKAFKSGSPDPALYVQKGVAKDEYSVDGLSGATLTSNGVTHLLQFWLGKDRFGSYFSKQKGSGS
jgi:Na+-transporting NADH:ubiquinone oxidoreductase subunit C